MAHHLGRDRAWVIAHPEAAIDGPGYEALVARRAAGEPIAYIRGFVDWHSLRIATDRRALIPRPETELLADATVAEIERRLALGPVTAWDVATGSGAVAIVLALSVGGTATLLASDLSTDALELARANLAAHEVTDLVDLRQADLLDGEGPMPDVVVANLPYVASAEVDARNDSLGFEPRIALDGGPDGLVLLRRLLADAPARIAPGGAILLEIGADQAASVERLAPAGASVGVVADLAGLDRVVRVDLPTLAR